MKEKRHKDSEPQTSPERQDESSKLAEDSEDEERRIESKLKSDDEGESKILDESLANAKQYIQKNKAAFSNTTHEPVPVPVLLPPVGQVQRDKTQSDVKTSRKKNVPNGRRNKKYVVFELVGKYEHEIAIRIQSQFFRLSIEHFTYAPC